MIRRAREVMRTIPALGKDARPAARVFKVPEVPQRNGSVPVSGSKVEPGGGVASSIMDELEKANKTVSPAYSSPSLSHLS